MYFSRDLDTSVELHTGQKLRKQCYLLNIGKEIEAETVTNVPGALQKGAEWEEEYRGSFLLISYKLAQ